MSADLSEKAIDCFVHGVAHLICELGPEKGLSSARRLIDVLATTNPEQILGELHVSLADVPDGARA